MTAWADRTPSVKGLVLIGSRERPAGDAIWKVDSESDWDFQIITSETKPFATRSWTRELVGMDLRHYATRVARVGGVPRINAIFTGAEADFKIIPADRLRLAKFLVGLGCHRKEGWVRRGLQDLAVVVRPGWRFLKGSKGWDGFYRRVVNEVSDARLNNDDAMALANVFVCEARWVRLKAVRGELAAVQRMLHRELGETNFRLLHELKLRRGEPSFPDARRIERVTSPAELSAVRVNARMEIEELLAAVTQSESTLRMLMAELVGDRWQWPELS